MDTRLIRKADLATFLDSLSDDFEVIAPKKTDQDEVVFDTLAPGQTPELDYVNTLLPPKSLFFERREVLFSIEGGRHPKLTPAPESKPIAVFGLRSCDATALGFLDSFFTERGFEDVTITEKIRSALRMTLACQKPGEECFCVCCEGGPFLTQYFDLQFTDLGDRFLVDVGTPKGEEAVQKGGKLFSPATDKEKQLKRALVAKVDSLFTRRSYMSRGIKTLSLNKIPAETWEKWAEDCQSCGGCCFVCPTCSCFTITDRETGPDAFVRERMWDSCLYAGFTREASNHNPRAKAGERLKRRFFHKMSFQCIERMGRHGCVGCGRCVTACMGGLDISNLLGRIKDAI
jgi:sulfhydrogenase subunit beta (sulfur reductase)